MEISQTSIANFSLKSSLLVVPLSAKELKVLRSNNPKAIGKLPLASTGIWLSLTNIIGRKGFEFTPFQTLIVNPGEIAKGACILAVSLPTHTQTEHELLASCRKLGSIIASQSNRLHYKSVALLDIALDLDSTKLEALYEGIVLSNYRFDLYKSARTKSNNSVSELQIISNRKLTTLGLSGVKSTCNATMLARDLINMPAKDCTPSYLAQAARQIAKKGKLVCKIMNHKELARMGAGGILMVGQASEFPPCLIKLTYKPKKKKSSKVISLVGKGITFDTGGLQIKSAAGMLQMKCDMSGAAAVLATMQAISEIKPDYEIRGYLACAENMVGGNAMRPGDVLKTLSGKTVEVLNTDAEGRLVLSDALHLASKDRCDVIIDIATLTGACAAALGDEIAGIFSTEPKLCKELKDAGDSVGESYWEFPLAKVYKDFIQSSVADLKNKPDGGGVIGSALFLQEFVREEAWAHLDIAGTAFANSDKGYIKKGGVGFGTRTLIKYLLNQNTN